MFRFLRQYNKWILAVGGTLLLVSWALSGTISSFSQYSAREGSVWATYGPDNTKVTLGSLEQLRGELRVLDALDSLFGTPVVPIQGAERDPAHWFLLSKEADDAGLVGGLSDGQPILEAIAQGSGMTADQAAMAIAQQSGTSVRMVKETLAKVNGVNRLREVVISMPRFSDARLRHAASETLLGMAGDVVVLDARKLAAPEVATPSDEALAAQLAKFGNDEPGKGERGFGYRLPNRLKIEWIQIPEAGVRTAIEQSAALDTLTLKKRFAADPTKYGAAPAAPGADPLALFPMYEATVRQRTLDELVNERMAEIAKFGTDQLALAQRGLPKDGAFVRLPDDWATRRLDLKTLASEIGTQFKVPFPAYGSLGDAWMSIRDIEVLPGLGTASTTRFSPTPIQLGSLLAKLKEFGAPDDTIPMQQDVATPPLTATNRDLYFARVIATDPSRAPTSIEEVRAALTTDVQAIERFAALEAMESEIRNKAATIGPRELANEFGATLEFAGRIHAADPRALGFGVKFPGTIPGLGGDPKAIAALMKLVNTLPKRVPVADIPEAERTFVVALPDRLAILVTRVTDLFPLTSEEYQTIVTNPQAQRALADDSLRAAQNDAFTLDALMKRYNFKLNLSNEDEAGAATTTPAPSTPAGSG